MIKVQITDKGKTLGAMHIVNIRKLLAVGVMGFTLFTVTGCQKEEIGEVKIIAEDISEKRYDGVFYVVQNGDTLTEIVNAYESNPNTMYRYVQEVTRRNRIDRLKAGDIIELVGVPESKLINYGYSSNYEETGNDYYIEDAREFLESRRSWVVETEENEIEVALFEEKVDYLEILYQDYKEATDEEVKEYLEEKLALEYGIVLEDLLDLTGINFENHRQAHEIKAEKRMGIKQ